MLSTIAFGLRGLQFVFAIVILGLAVTLFKQQVYGSAPTTTTYSIFTGAFGIIVAVAGVAGLLVDAIPSIVNLVLDGVLGILFLGGGIAWAVGLKGINCKSQETQNAQSMLFNGLLNQGSTDAGHGNYYGVADGATTPEEIFDRLTSNCQKAMADEVVQFISFGLAIGLVVVTFLNRRKGGYLS
ncbi:marvel domain-containing protein [Podospora appendiculata]|uniref:Marvel domain-containing protein n=1 Tax=Podospora appendiculata TaxID=314037 RepID=A0AAE0X6V9_9PEZI|nr:marvel domain-containing protein [Podospora appendiculata]